MKTYIINLSAASRRLDFQEQQLRALNIDFERIEAITPERIPANISSNYWKGWERPLSPSECACFLSHREIWKRIVIDEKPALVLEDDAVLAATLPIFLDKVEMATDIDHISLETRGRRKLLSKRPHQHLPMRRLYQDKTGAAAYILWPSGARKLIAHTDRTAMLADAAICSAYQISSWQATPPLAFQLDRCSLYRITAPLVTISSIGSTKKGPVDRKFIYRLRRILAQIRMGIRLFTCIFIARQEYISPQPEDFVYLLAHEKN